MKQSLLAFLAMSIFSLLALSQQRASMHYHSLVYGRDYEMAAMNMVSEQLAYIETLYYDEADTDKDPFTQRLETEDLSATFGLELGESSDLLGIRLIGADDIDDYHLFQLPATPYQFNGNQYTFDLKVEVCYIDPLGSGLIMSPDQTAEGVARARCQSSKSLAKQVLISLSETIPEDLDENDAIRYSGRAPVNVSISRIFSPAGLSFH